MNLTTEHTGAVAVVRCSFSKRLRSFSIACVALAE